MHLFERMLKKHLVQVCTFTFCNNKYLALRAQVIFFYLETHLKLRHESLLGLVPKPNKC